MGLEVIDFFDKEAGFEGNSVPSKTHPGIPKLISCGREVPVIFMTTPKGSITSKIMAEMLKRLDGMDVSQEQRWKLINALHTS